MITIATSVKNNFKEPWIMGPKQVSVHRYTTHSKGYLGWSIVGIGLFVNHSCHLSSNYKYEIGRENTDNGSNIQGKR